MPTVRRAAWAEWAAWTCKEPQGSLLPDARRLVDMKTPGGKLPGVFVVGARPVGRQILAAHPSLSTHTSKGVETLPRMRHISVVSCVVPCVPVATRRFTTQKDHSMSSSNIAVRMEHTATDLLSHPPRPLLRIVASNVRPVQSVRLSTSFKNRKFLKRDQGLRYLRIR